MGNQPTTEKKIDLLNRPDAKPTDIKIDKNVELPKIQLTAVNLPKPPVIKTRAQLKIEQEEKEQAELIPFSLKDEFDLGTYSGRFYQQLSRNNPRNFFYTNKEIADAQVVMFKYKTREEVANNLGQKVRMKAEEIELVKRADKITGGAVHPDTQELIPIYMRLSGFVVFNTPLVLITLFTRNQTPIFNAGMQWINQTYNAAMNYGNRNVSSTLSTQDLAKGYGGAVAVSVSIALFSRIALAKQISALQGPKLILASACLNYFAAAFAGATNLLMIRQKEMQDGINV